MSNYRGQHRPTWPIGMGFERCPVCDKEHSETVLVGQRSTAKVPDRACLDINLCAEHKKAGYIALIGSQPPDSDGNIMRTGQLLYVRTSAWSQIFNGDAPLPANGFTFCPPEVIEKLTAMEEQRAAAAGQEPGVEPPASEEGGAS